MKYVNGFWLPDADTYFEPILKEKGNFEIDHLNVALKYVHNFSSAIDGGACFGGWTIPLACRFGWVYAFEPQRDNYEALRENVQTYGNVTPLPWALGDQHSPPTCRMQESVTRTGNVGSYFMSVGETTQVKTIDSLRLRNLGFIKLDVEGSEAPALRGAEETILSSHPVILIEEKRFRDQEYRLYNNPDAAKDYLKSLGMVMVEKMGNDAIYIWE